ncbi:unnamed protein product, partial [marine sediment metagenome]
KVKDRTIVAIISIVAITFMVYIGHNGAMISLLAIIMGFYFGRETGDQEVE